MGIDVYLRWKDQTEEERKAQFTGFSVEAGHVGYLREAYHGGPYATEVLVPEAFDDHRAEQEPAGVRIPVATLRQRLPAALEAARRREQVIYHRKGEVPDDDPVLKAFADFVELAERLEVEGREPRVYVSA